MKVKASSFLSFEEVRLSSSRFVENHRLSLIKSEFKEEQSCQYELEVSFFVIPGYPLKVVEKVDQKLQFGICKIDFFSPDQGTTKICKMASCAIHYRLFQVVNVGDTLGVLTYLHPNLN